MLTRRDELFPLARQVVRDSGYQYSKGHSRYGDFAKIVQRICESCSIVKLSSVTVSTKLKRFLNFEKISL